MPYIRNKNNALPTIIKTRRNGIKLCLKQIMRPQVTFIGILVIVAILRGIDIYILR